jgi:hypothetical protein
MSDVKPVAASFWKPMVKVCFSVDPNASQHLICQFNYKT